MNNEAKLGLAKHLKVSVGASKAVRYAEKFMVIAAKKDVADGVNRKYELYGGVFWTADLIEHGMEVAHSVESGEM